MDSTKASDVSLMRAEEYLERVMQLNTDYRAGRIHAYVPDALHDSERTLESLAAVHLPASQAAFEAASRSLFYSLPVAFDPAQSVGPYLAVVEIGRAHV